MESKSGSESASLRAISRMHIAKQSPASHRRGQAAVEFALVLTVAMIVLFVAIQLALIGQVALALGQVNYQGARYAAVHPECGISSCATAGESNINDYMKNVASPTLNWSNVTVAVCDSDGTVTCTAPGTDNSPTTQRTFGNPVTVALKYNCTSNLFFGPTFLGISFPTNLNSTETAMSE